MLDGEASPAPVIDLARMAEQDGYEAFVSDQGLDENPFTPGHELHGAWERGWTEARDYHDRWLAAP